MVNWREIKNEKKRRKQEIKSIEELHDKTVKSLKEKHNDELNKIPLLAQKEIDKIMQQAEEMSKNDQQLQLLRKRIEKQRPEIENRIRVKLIERHKEQLRLSEEWKFEQMSSLTTIAEYEEALTKAKYYRPTRRHIEYEELDYVDTQQLRAKPEGHSSYSVPPNPYAGPTCPKCKSRDIFTDTKGYSVTQGVIGAAALGPVGLVGGMIGSKKKVKRCGKCGYTY